MDGCAVGPERAMRRSVSGVCFLGAELAAALLLGAHASRAEGKIGGGVPVTSISIVWAGHSLINTKVPSDGGDLDLMSTVGSLARERGLGYEMVDHTFSGVPMSALWRGRPHSYPRDAGEMVVKREALERNASRYNALVVTEALPLQAALANESSVYYLRLFYCALKRANPAAQVFLYESWIHLHGSDRFAGFPPIQRFDWRAEMIAQRGRWEWLADKALAAVVPKPGWLASIGLDATSDGGCKPTDPILIVPVGRALVGLADRLATPKDGDVWAQADGRRIELSDFFANPYVNLPKEWPLRGTQSAEAKSSAAALVLRHPMQPLDDIHLTAIGIYFVALVHFSTLYRQSPVGLAAPAAVGTKLARTMQCIAWSVVVANPRSGVHGREDCGGGQP